MYDVSIFLKPERKAASDTSLEPDFVFDISAYHNKKIEAVLCYTTQFMSSDTSEPQTYISTPDFIETVKARALMLGKRIGVEFAEGYISSKMIGVESFDAFIQITT